MAIKVGINGFGRIGRLVLQAMVEKGVLGKDMVFHSLFQLIAVGIAGQAQRFIQCVKLKHVAMGSGAGWRAGSHILIFPAAV